MSTRIPLPARVDLKAAEVLKTSFLEASGAVVVVADEVEMVGAQGLQVLMAGARHIAAEGETVEIMAPSASFLSCLTDLGADLDDVSTAGAAT